MFHNEQAALKIWAEQGPISALLVNDLLIDGSTFAGIEIKGSYPITSAVFEHIQIKNAGTNGMVLSANLAGGASFSFVVISDSAKEALLNYSPKLNFKLIFGVGNDGWQFP